MSKAGWRWAFLGLTAVVLGMEVWAGFDGNPDTDPWTDLVVAYIPGEVTALALGGLSVWLFAHFGIRYWRKHQAKKESRDQVPQ